MVRSGVKREEMKRRPVVIPYIRGFSEELKRTFGGSGYQLILSPQTLCGTHKRSSGEGQVVGPVYKISCR